MHRQYTNRYIKVDMPAEIIILKIKFTIEVSPIQLVIPKINNAFIKHTKVSIPNLLKYVFTFLCIPYLYNTYGSHHMFVNKLLTNVPITIPVSPNAVYLAKATERIKFIPASNNGLYLSCQKDHMHL